MSPTARTRLATLLFVAPVVLQLLFVGRFAVNSMVWDEHYYVEFVKQVREGGDLLPLLFIQHNEHRVVPMRLVMIPNALWGDWNRVNEMYVSVALGALVVLGLWLYGRRAGIDPLLSAPVSWIVMSVSQYENLLYGMMTCHYFTLLGVVWALVCLDRRGPGWVAAAIGFGSLASFSILNGLLVWPIGALVLIVQGRRVGAVTAWILVAVAAAWAYLRGLAWPRGAQSIDVSIAGAAGIARYFVKMLGAPLSGGSVAWAIVIGLAIVAFSLIMLRAWIKGGREVLADDAFAAALLLFGVMTCAMIALGRTGMIPPLQSRYISYSSLAIVGVYLLVMSDISRRGGRVESSRFFAAVVVLLSAGIVASNLYGIVMAREWKIERTIQKYQLQTFERQSEETLGTHCFVEMVKANTPYLRDHGLGPFADPQELLIPGGESSAVSHLELAAGEILEQNIVSPIDVIHDVALEIHTSAADERTRVSMSFESDEGVIASSTIPAQRLNRTDWIRLPLGTPLADSRGRHFRLKVTLEPGATDQTVMVATYPAYYEGELRHGGEVKRGRVAGVSLDAIRLKVIR